MIRQSCRVDVDGGTGLNSLDFGNYSTSRNFYLTGLGTLTGFAGSEREHSGDVPEYNQYHWWIGIRCIEWNKSTRSLGRFHQVAAHYSSMNRTLMFTGMESYNGSGYDDTFKIVENPNYRLLGAMNNLIGLGNIDGRSGTTRSIFQDFQMELLQILLMDISM
jgi:hypothetical protein